MSGPGLDMSELKNLGYFSANDWYLLEARWGVSAVRVFDWNVSRIHDGLMCHFVCMLLLHSLLLLRALEVLLCSISLIKTLVSQASSMNREAFVPDNSPVQQTKSVRQTSSLQVCESSVPQSCLSEVAYVPLALSKHSDMRSWVIIDSALVIIDRTKLKWLFD